MKIYDYVCSNCGKQSEEFVGHVDETVYCTECKHMLTRQVSAPGMVKGNFESKPGFKRRGM